MKTTSLYQKSKSTGNTKEWHIRVDDKGTHSEIVIESAQKLGGKKVKNTALVSEGKNIGKVNATTHYTQAVSEAKAKIELKLREGYVDDVNKVQCSSVLGSGMRQPMLAQKYHPTGAQNGSKTLKQMKIEDKLIHVQPKLDGNRCLILVNKDGATMYTRKGDVMPVQLDHILNDVISKFKFSKEEELILDGELYCDPEVMSFNTLNGLIKRQKATPEQVKERLKIKYYLYDVMLDEGYLDRYEAIQYFQSDNIDIIPSYQIYATDGNIQAMLDKFLADGYEGLMIRALDKGYENKRSWQLVKVKIFEDREFELIGFEEDKRGGFVGNFIFDLPESLLKELGKPLVDAQGKKIVDFHAGASGQTVEDRTYMLKHPEEFIGKIGTVEYFGWDYRPRFPKFKGLRNDV